MLETTHVTLCNGERLVLVPLKELERQASKQPRAPVYSCGLTGQRIGQNPRLALIKINNGLVRIITIDENTNVGLVLAVMGRVSEEPMLSEEIDTTGQLDSPEFQRILKKAKVKYHRIHLKSLIHYLSKK